MTIFKISIIFIFFNPFKWHLGFPNCSEVNGLPAAKPVKDKYNKNNTDTTS